MWGIFSSLYNNLVWKILYHVQFGERIAERLNDFPKVTKSVKTELKFRLKSVPWGCVSAECSIFFPLFFLCLSAPHSFLASLSFLQLFLFGMNILLAHLSLCDFLFCFFFESSFFRPDSSLVFLGRPPATFPSIGLSKSITSWPFLPCCLLGTCSCLSRDPHGFCYLPSMVSHISVWCFFFSSVSHL